MILNIQHSTIKALLIFAAEKDVRYYLKGVCVDVRAATDARPADVTLVATDGVILLAHPVPLEDVDGVIEPGQYIIPREALEAIAPMKAGRTALPIKLTIVTPAPTVDAEGRTVAPRTEIEITGATALRTAPIDGRFPDWRRVMPRTVSNVPAPFDGRLIARVAKAYDYMNDKSKYFQLTIHHNGQDGASLITGWRGDGLGLIKPMRDPAPFPETSPAWSLA
jgi:DNA polymerase-3 subunit beta